MKKDDKKPSDVSPSISMVSFSVADEPEIKKINHDESDHEGKRASVWYASYTNCKSIL